MIREQTDEWDVNDNVNLKYTCSKELLFKFLTTPQKIKE